MKQTSKFLATFFYLGFFPRFHASITSIAGFVIYEALVRSAPGNYVALLAYLIPFIFGIIAVYYYLKHVSASSDPREVVLDEFFAAGLIPFVLHAHLILAFFALLLFRMIDLLKPGFIKKIDEWNYWPAIFLDDFAAVFIALIVVKPIEMIIYGIA